MTLPWRGAPYAPKSRDLRDRLDRLAPSVHVDVKPRDLGTPALPVVQRDLTIRLRGEEIRGMETISPFFYAASIMPRCGAAATFLLLSCRAYGRPTTVYADAVDAARDLTAEWRSVTDVRGEMLRGAMRQASGMRLSPLSVEDLERAASEWI